MDTLEKYQELELCIVRLFDFLSNNLETIDEFVAREILLFLESCSENYRFLCVFEHIFQPINSNYFLYSIMFLHEIVSLKIGIYRENHPMYRVTIIHPRNEIIGIQPHDVTQGRLEEIYSHLHTILMSFKS